MLIRQRRITNTPKSMMCKEKFCNSVVLETFEYCKEHGYIAGVVDVNGKAITANTKEKYKYKSY